ncbi:MAG: VWA domain-containing protein [Chitinophagales bacterium]|nr:VWA domain-containing protein [Chitinophagales bacterium]
MIDISASMNQEGKIDTLKYALKHLIQLLKPTDRISIVTYSNFAKLYMDTKDGTRKDDITQAIDRITCYGFTNGGQGLDLAFKTAVKNYIKDGNNKVILVTDGIFTTTKNKENKSMEKMVKQMYNKKIALSAFSFGDIEQEAKDYLSRLSKLGGGSYAHIQDTPTAKTVMKKEALRIGAFNSK